jgi:hypothetical protein
MHFLFSLNAHYASAGNCCELISLCPRLAELLILKHLDDGTESRILNRRLIRPSLFLCLDIVVWTEKA